jgi:hypothetical protein
VVGKDCTPSTGHKPIYRFVECVWKPVQFTVHLDPDRLEGSLGRVTTGSPDCRWDRRSDNFGKFQCVANRSSRYHCSSDAMGETLVSVSGQDPG